MAEAAARYAVVTGPNKGIGLETIRQLASKGVKVVLRARDEKKGLEAVQKLKDSGLSDLVIFHQLDVANPGSIASLADFIKTQFGRLDIMVNNAGIVGATVDYHDSPRPINAKFMASVTQLTPQTYYKDIPNELARGVFTDPKNLTEENVEEVLSEFLKDFKEGSLETKGWGHSSAYVLSKAALNAYTKILAKRYPSFCINCVCPGFVKTDINWNTGKVPVEEGAAHPVRLALLPKGGPSGLFFVQQEVSPFLS